ncbi:MAG: hypothetical protein NDJ90_04920 [Oligoflexia bacterium]|nr:hypothetical protein [Oligoflexia bacterium]
MWRSFHSRVPGKWVLAGEHAVLRGATAVALPHPELGLTLAFEPGSFEGLRVVPESAARVILELLESVRDACEERGRSFGAPAGTLEIQSSIPIGAGLGSSAALCVAMSRWLRGPLGLAERELLDFATQLEDRFHGKSSGMDVAVIATGEPVTFVRGVGPKPLGVKHLPKFTFHDTALRCRTHECVSRVEAFRDREPARAMRVDEAMGEAARFAIEGLVQYDRGDRSRGLELLAQAMARGQECFRAWDLLPPEAGELERSLLAEGALGVKITGAGGGGMLVALWKD